MMVCMKNLTERWIFNMYDIQYEKQNYKGPHCCWQTDVAVKNNLNNVSPCKYNPKFREYSIKSTREHMIEVINYCPRCSKKYSKRLRDEWFDILEKEYDLNNPNCLDQCQKIPSEFLTDE